MIPGGIVKDVRKSIPERGCIRGPGALWAVLVAVFLLFPSTSLPEDPAAPTLGIEDIRPGMKGYGLTVFRGTEPERFEVEVVAILKNFLLRQDLILVRCKHPIIEDAGIIAGMSGSPIYLEGKLVGALAYGWTFSRETLAGVTPIRNMMEALKRADEEKKGRESPGPGKGDLTLRGGGFGRPSDARALRVVSPDSPADGLAARAAPFRLGRQESSDPMPVETPLVLGGFSQGAIAGIRETLAPFGIEPLQGGGGRAAAGGDAGKGKLVPGGALGVELIRGDLSAVAVGTVTALIGGRALAFGHPMMNMGKSALGVTTATVHAIVSSVYRSFKLADPVADAGVLVEDRQASIVADTAERVRMIPVEVRLMDRTASRTDLYRVEIANQRFLTPFLSAMSIRSILEEGASDLADTTIEIASEIKLKGARTVKIRQTVFSSVGAAAVVTRLRPFDAIGDVLRNPFAEADIEKVDFRIDLSFKRDIALIKGAYLTTESPEPGEVVNLHVRLQPYAGAEEVVTLPVRIPEVPEGEVILIEVAGGGDVAPDLVPPRGLDDFLDNLEKGYPERSMVVTLWLRSAGVLVQGKAVQRLPPSALDSLRPAAADLKEIPQRAMERKVMDMKRIIAGSASVEVRVERKKMN